MTVDEIRAWLSEHEDDVAKFMEFEIREGVISDSWFNDWFGNTNWHRQGYRFERIGSDACGGIFAAWIREGDDAGPPMVFFGSEGGRAVLSDSPRSLVFLIAHGAAVDEFGDNYRSSFHPDNNYYLRPEDSDYEDASAALTRFRDSTLDRFGELPSLDVLANGTKTLDDTLHRWVEESSG